MKLRSRRSVRKGVKSTIHFGSVPYLNAKPLCAPLPDARLEHPPRLLELLERGEVDVALLSSVEVLRNPETYAYVPGLGVGSDGPVDSVRLYTRTAIRDIQSVGLDPHSLTANVLTRIILTQNYGVQPKYGRRRNTSWREFDATVVIGDQAFRFDEGRYIDLGAEWKLLTGLPFVYALWIYRRGHPTAGRIEKEVYAAYCEGRRRLAEIASTEASRLFLDKAYCLRYLNESIRYSVGPREEQGLELFGRYLREMGAL